MPLIFKEFISRADLRENRSALFIFGDNEARRGMGGQAAEMRGEPNAHGIRTKKAPSNEPYAFWTDADFRRVVLMIRDDFAKPYQWISEGKHVVFPTALIGTGLAGLDYHAPKIMSFIHKKIELLKVISDQMDEEESLKITNLYDI